MRRMLYYVWNDKYFEGALSLRQIFLYGMSIGFKPYLIIIWNFQRIIFNLGKDIQPRDEI